MSAEKPWEDVWSPPEAAAQLDPFRFVDAADWFAEDDHDADAILWGTRDGAYWVDGESLLIVAPVGVGKTTLAGVLLEGMLGLRDEVLGLPIKPLDGPVLYLAMDRPKQIRRALRRRLGNMDPELLRGRLIIQDGPLLENLVSDPTLLLRAAERCGAVAVIADSVKDLAIRLSDEETGGSYNRARQLLCASGRQLVELHHQKKAGSDGKPPKTLADVYGSTMIAAGAGSVLLLWGQAGDAAVDVIHLRSPLGDVPTTRAHIDNDLGTIEVEGERIDPLKELVNRQSLTANTLAGLLAGTERPEKKDVDRALRSLRRLERQGYAEVIAEPGGASGGRARQTFYPTVTATLMVSPSNLASNLAPLPGMSNLDSNLGNLAAVTK